LVRVVEAPVYYAFLKSNIHIVLNLHKMETREQIMERLKANSRKLEELMDKVLLLAGDMKSEEIERMKKEINDIVWDLRRPMET
jgi:uncharacterized protein YcbK (DUF882 family)